jgi:hypothetical protein
MRKDYNADNRSNVIEWQRNNSYKNMKTKGAKS